MKKLIYLLLICTLSTIYSCHEVPETKYIYNITLVMEESNTGIIDTINFDFEGDPKASIINPKLKTTYKTHDTNNGKTITYIRNGKGPKASKVYRMQGSWIWVSTESMRLKEKIVPKKVKDEKF